jgi:hypothetical protein
MIPLVAVAFAFQSVLFGHFLLDERAIDLAI